MKAINLLPILFTLLIIACTDDEKGEGNKPDTPSYSSSSIIMKIDSLHLSGLGQSYKTMTIGSKTWLAQNLNETPTSGKWWCYGDIVNPGDFAEHCNKYGKLYDWDAAKSVCPSGWHLPSRNEWADLSDFLEEYGKDILTKAWWNATYVGYRHEDGSWPIPLDQAGYWWTSSTAGNDRAYCYSTVKGQNRFYGSDEEKAKGLSVRCVKD